MQQLSSATKWLVGFALVGTLVAGCNLPGFGEPETQEQPFVVTPYSPGVSTATPLAAPAVTPTARTEPGARAVPTTAVDTALVSAGEDAAPAEAIPITVSSTPQTYNGEVKAKDRVTVVAEVGGTLLEVLPEVGDFVTAGDVVARIDSAILEAQRAQAKATLDAAQAQLNLLLEEADDTDIGAARAAVAAAAAAYERALEGPTEEDRRAAEAQLRQAQAGVTSAQAAYNRVKGDPNIAARPESLQLQQATLAVEAAQAQYDKVIKGSTDDVIAGAYAQLEQARASLSRLEQGAKPAQIEAAQAQVHQAEIGLYLSQLQLDKAIITAPSDGIVTEVDGVVGAMVGIGAPVVKLMSQEKEVTIAVDETRLAEVLTGQRAVIRVDAFPDRTFAGEVIRIAPELDPATRTVQVTIRPTQDAGLLAPGMFATVELSTAAND